MSGPLDSLKTRLKTRVKLRIAGQDLDRLVQNRSRQRLRWVAQYHDDEVMRFRALRNLAEILDPEVVPTFTAIAEAEPGTYPTGFVVAAVDGLGRLLHGDSVDLLERLLRRNRPVAVNLAAASALARLERAEAWAAVRRFVVDAESREAPLVPDERDALDPVRREPVGTTTLAWVLRPLFADKDGKWLGSKASAWLKSDQPVPRLQSDKGSDKIVAQQMRYALEKGELPREELILTVLHLGSLGRERDHALFPALLERQGDPELRRALWMATGLQGDLRNRALLEEELGRAEDVATAADLVRALGRLARPESAAALDAARRRFPDPTVRLNVAWSLGECGGGAAVGLLCDYLRGRSGGSADGKAAVKLDAAELATDEEVPHLAYALQRCGTLGREAIRGAAKISRVGGGERSRFATVSEITGIH